MAIDSFATPSPLSGRQPVFAGNMVATSQPLAVQAGLEMLRKGGNAVDAALAAAITLTVVEPVSNGIGSDAFAIIWDGKRLTGLNGSGRSPGKWSLDYFRRKPAMPQRGWDTVTVPGAVKAWADLSGRFGRLPFKTLFRPAIRYAAEGFPVSPKTALSWKSQAELLKGFPEFLRTFCPGGKPPATGELFKCKDQAETLLEIAETKGRSFYEGKIAEKIAAYSRKCNGLMRLDDLESHRSDWVDTISADYSGVTLHEIPPNGQGAVALIALGILESLKARIEPDSPDTVHLQLEAVKLAFCEAFNDFADPRYMQRPIEEILSKNNIRKLAARINAKRASECLLNLPKAHGTVYLTAADSSGMMVSFIQSNFGGFGSGIVIPGTGISLQNRGTGFNRIPGHPNCIGGNQRPFHTIIPALVMRGKKPLMSFGVMGGHMQPQGHVQVMCRVFSGGQNPQTALDAPRWHVFRDGGVGFENGFPAKVIAALRKRGHRINRNVTESLFGGGQCIMRLPDGYLGASDRRKDGQAAGF
jgi:gamma-glutamyltranspeptidase / glutathione hydrolase